MTIQPKFAGIYGNKMNLQKRIFFLKVQSLSSSLAYMTVGVYALTGSDFISVSFKYIYFKPIVYQLVYPLSSVCQIYIWYYKCCMQNV